MDRFKQELLVLVVIDLQQQFRDKNGEYERLLRFIENNKENYFVIGSLFYNTPNSMYQKHLNWGDCSVVSFRDLEYDYDKIILKETYSLDYRTLKDCAIDLWYDKTKQYDEVAPPIRYDLIGCDSDACVLATAFTLWDNKADFRILGDYLYTSSDELKNEEILKIYKRNFGDIVVK